MMVVTLGQIVNFTNEEESAYKMFRRLEYADNIRSKAIQALSSAFKKIILLKKSKKKSLIEEQNHKLEKNLKKFHLAIDSRNKFCNPDSDLDKLQQIIGMQTEQITEIKGHISGLEAKIDTLTSFIMG